MECTCFSVSSLAFLSLCVWASFLPSCYSRRVFYGTNRHKSRHKNVYKQLTGRNSAYNFLVVLNLKIQ